MSIRKPLPSEAHCPPQLVTLQSLRSANSRALSAPVERAVQHSGVDSIAGIELISLNQLESGDLEIRTTRNTGARTLRARTENPPHRVETGLTVRNPSYGVLVHPISISTAHTGKLEEDRKDISHDSRGTLPNQILHAPNTSLARRRGDLRQRSPSATQRRKTRTDSSTKVWSGKRKCFGVSGGVFGSSASNRKKNGHVGAHRKAVTARGYGVQDHSSEDCRWKGQRPDSIPARGGRKCNAETSSSRLRQHLWNALA